MANGYSDDDDHSDDDYPSNNDYKTHQQNWETMRDDAQESPDDWEEHELLNNEALLAEIEAEKEGRERARDELAEDDQDEGHDARIEKLEDTAQLARNQIAYCKGEYQHHSEPMRSHELEDEEEDMDIDEDGGG